MADFEIVPGAGDTLAVGKTAKPVKEVVTDGSLKDPSGNAMTPLQGKTAYDHSQVNPGNPHGSTAASVGADPAGTATAAVAAHASVALSVHGFDAFGNAPAQTHAVDGAKHTATGLTVGHFFKALTSTTFGFVAHGLTAGDVGADVTGTAAAAIVAHVGLSDPHTQYQKESEKAAANGYASLDAGGKVPVAQLPAAIMEFKGAWDVVANTPTLADGTGDQGDIYRASTAGTRDLGSGPQTWAVGDWCMYNGTIWQRSPATDAVTSVNTKTGAVVLVPSDIGAAAAVHVHAGTDITTGTIDGDRLPAMSTTKKGGVPATGTPSGLFLKDDGTWAAAGAGTVTSVTASVPLTSSGGTTPNLALGTAAAPTTADALADVIWGTSGTTKKALVLQGKAGQTANLQSWQNSTGAALAGMALPTEANLGAELITVAVDRDFTGANNWSGTGWSISANTFLHVAGANDATLAGYAATPSALYQIVMTIVTSTAGLLSIKYGGTSATAVGRVTGTLTNYTVLITAGGTNGLVVTPDATWEGSITNVSVKQNTVGLATLTLKNSAAVSGIETRALALTAFGIGVDALRANISGYNNLAVGYQALMDCTSAYYNTAVGIYALRKDTIGVNNTALGYSTLALNVSGSDNTAVGGAVLSVNVTGSNNTGVGSGALTSNTAGTANTSIGYLASAFNSTGGYNAAIGSQALRYNTTGSNNVAAGSLALVNNTTGFSNVATGMYAMQNNLTGYYNTASGYQSLNASTAGTNDTALGYRAGYIATGINNTFLGSTADIVSTQRNNVTAIGYNAKVDQDNSMILGQTGATAPLIGVNTTTPRAQVDVIARSATTIGAITQAAAAQTANIYEWQDSAGAAIARINSTGSYDWNRGTATYSFAAGSGAGRNITSAVMDTLIGYTAGYALTSGSYCTLIGRSAGAALTTQSSLTAIGANAAIATTVGEAVFIGASSGYNHTTGTHSVMVGTQSGYHSKVASDAVYLGHNAGFYVAFGAGNTLIGAATGVPALGSVVSVTGDGATVTVTATGHGMFTNEWVVMYPWTGGTGNWNGSYQITKINDNVFTYAATGNGTATGGSVYRQFTGITAIGHNALVGQSDSMVLGKTGSLAPLVGINTTTPGAQLHAVCRTATTIGQINQAASAQTANIHEWRDSTATTLVHICAAGCFSLGNVTPGTSATKTIVQGTGTAPSTSPADAFQMYSADQAAGNACAHFRTELGSIIKLYQQTHIADPTGGTADAEARTVINAILVLLENLGLAATS